MAKAYTWTAPLAKPLSPAAVAQAGGSLDIGRTYYYRVVAVDAADAAIDQRIGDIYSVGCVEVSATTSAVNRQIQISWNAVAGAAAYHVYRSWTSDNYSGSARFRRLSDNNSVLPTTTGITMTDAGAYSLYNTSTMQIAPSTHPNLDGLDYRVDFGGHLLVSGGTSVDQITLKNIYDWMVANVANYQKYVFYDGITFSAIFALEFDNTIENHFLATKKVIKFARGASFKAEVSGSNLQFGKIDATSGMEIEGCTIVNAGAYYNTPIYFAGNCKLYDTNYSSVYINPEWAFYKLIGTRWVRILGMEDAIGFTIDGFTYNSLYADDIQSIGLKSLTPYFEVFYSPYLCWKMESRGHFNLQYGGLKAYRFDEATVYDTGKYMQVRNNNAVPQTHEIVNPVYPNSTDSELLPVFKWVGTNDTSYAKVYFNFILKVVDVAANTISGAIVAVKDKDGNNGVDSDGTALNLTTDGDGMLFRERITVTAATASTITDSSKSWTIDQWKGRNIYINDTGEVMKIKSNTATVLTLIADVLVTTSVGDKLGIIFELLRFKAMHKVGGGDIETTRTEYSPFILKIKKAEYQTYKKKFTIAKKIDWTIRLIHSNVCVDQEVML